MSFKLEFSYNTKAHPLIGDSWTVSRSSDDSVRAPCRVDRWSRPQGAQRTVEQSLQRSPPTGTRLRSLAGLRIGRKRGVHRSPWSGLCFNPGDTGRSQPSGVSFTNEVGRFEVWHSTKSVLRERGMHRRRLVDTAHLVSGSTHAGARQRFTSRDTSNPMPT